MTPKCNEDISVIPEYEMFPKEKEYREKYRFLIHKKEELDNFITINKPKCEAAHKALLLHSSVLENKEHILNVVRGLTISLLFIVTVFIFGMYINTFGLFLLSIIVDIAIYKLVVYVPKSQRNDEKSVNFRKYNDWQSLKNSIDNATKELQTLPPSIDSLKKEFCFWVRTRNELIDTFSRQSLYEYLDLPFEPLLNEKFQPVGTDDNPFEFTVYTKSCSRGYRYHRTISCVPGSKYSKPTSLLVVDAYKYGLLPCQTCCTNLYGRYEWLFNVQDKYKNAIEILEKHDIKVELTPNQHTRVITSPNLQYPLNDTSSGSNKDGSSHQTSTDTLSNDLGSQISELSKEIVILKKINNTHEQTIASLKMELSTARVKIQNASAISSEERMHYETKIEQLKGELKEPNYYKNLFISSFRKLEKEGDTLFYNYPSVYDFYNQITDKRFHRAMIEDIAITGKVNIEASIRSGDNTYTTTLQNCSCVDYQRTRAPCKHMLYLAYHTGVLLIHKDEVEKSLKVYLDVLRATKVPKK